MVEWHLTPDYIFNNWTEELFYLMSEQLVERKQRELEAAKGPPPGPHGNRKGTVVSDEQLIRALGKKAEYGN